LSGYTDALIPLLGGLIVSLWGKHSLSEMFWIHRPQNQDMILLMVALGLTTSGSIMGIQIATDLVSHGAVTRFLERFPAAPTPQSPAVAMLTVGIVLPTLEELFFRGFLLSSFTPEVFGVGGQIWITALLFTLGHPVLVMPSVLVISVFGALSVVSSKSLAPALALHIANNLFAQGLDYLYPINGYLALATALAAVIAGITIACSHRQGVAEVLQAFREYTKDFSARARFIAKTILTEWSYILFILIAVLNIIVFFVPSN